MYENPKLDDGYKQKATLDIKTVRTILKIKENPKHHDAPKRKKKKQMKA